MPAKSHHCGRFGPAHLSRREMLARCAGGFGAVALAHLLGPLGHAAGSPRSLPAVLPHHRPRARSVIFLYMDGGPSQVDTFDYKPDLARFNGQNAAQVIGRLDDTQFDNIGTIMASPWEFSRHGQSGHWISSLFPHLATCADELAMLHSMTSKFPEHTSANYFLHTGHGLQGRPSMGAWFGYGLGSASENLPGFVVLNGGLIPPGGLDNFNSGFLPATFQASVFSAGETPVANIRPVENDPARQQRKLSLIEALDSAAGEARGPHDPAIEAAIRNYETAFLMQGAVPELADLTGESPATRKLYGLDADYEPTRIFGRQCLLARRLVERGVRFIEVTCPDIGNDRWDQHGNLRGGHEANARAVDQPAAALIRDLKARGLLEDTLVVWGGEFGRTPFAQGGDGRDHNPQGFTMWLAGGGIKGGSRVGATDAFGYRVAERKLEIHDLHATMLHLMGIDHEQLTYRFSGRDIRLTDVAGHVIHEVLA